MSRQNQKSSHKTTNVHKKYNHQGHKRKSRKGTYSIASLVVVLALALFGYGKSDTLQQKIQSFTAPYEQQVAVTQTTLDEIPAYQGESYVIINNNVPEFTDAQKQGPAYEFYSELDSLGRCGYAEAKVTQELMPTQERGAIGQVKPSGWHTVKYDCVDGKYLYNRCHLIGYQLTGENANEKNLITGTRYMNVEGMLPWENLVADYIKKTNDAVMYRVTPIYDGNNLVANGVQMEAQSVESDEISFNIFVFNIQPGIEINYADGSSQEVD